MAVDEKRYADAEHAYFLNGVQVPSITQMLKAAGHIDDTVYAEGSAERGRIVHALCADVDLGALDPAACQSVHRGFVLAHHAAMMCLRPSILSVEQPQVSATHRFGGRIDRVVTINGLRGCLDIKSGAPEPWHALQLALGCILESEDCGIPPENLGRWGLYIKDSGKWSVRVHDNKQDFSEARRILRDFAGR